MREAEKVRVLLIIPAYNEEANIQRVIGRVREYRKTCPYQLDYVVINDGFHGQHGPHLPGKTASTTSACCKTWALAAPSRRATCTPSGRATTSLCSSTATASTT